MAMSRERALAHDSRVALMRVLEAEDDPMDASQLAGRIGLHISTVRSHLALLEDAGLVRRETEQRTDPGRPRQLYRPTGRRREDDRYALLARMLASYIAADVPDPSAVAEETGRQWGRHLVAAPEPFGTRSAGAAHDTLVGILDDLGFAPQPDGPHRIDLRHCPFREVAEAHPEVVCAVHLGLVRGAMAQIDAPIQIDQLVPFVDPGRCVLTTSADEPADESAAEVARSGG